MYDLKIVDYNGIPLRTTLIEGKRWWALSDVYCKVVRSTHQRNYAGYLKKLEADEKRKIAVLHLTGFGGMQMHFVTDSGLFKILDLIGRPESDELKRWLINEMGMSAPQIKEPSVAVSLQKAQMLIRIAEHKAVPRSEQLRLLDMAAKELTGTGFNFNADKVVKLKQIDIDDDIMDLPEVVGFIHEKTTKDVNGCQVDFYPADMMASRWRTSNKNDETFNGEAFSTLADDFGYKTSEYGFWQRVITPKGEAREFMYMDGTLLDYLNKKYRRAA